MKRILNAAIIGCALLAFGTVGACDDHVGKCEIEDFLYRIEGFDNLVIRGVTTCDSGKIIIRVYDGEGESRKLVAIADGYIVSHTFTAMSSGGVSYMPDNVSFHYSIQ